MTTMRWSLTPLLMGPSLARRAFAHSRPGYARSSDRISCSARSRLQSERRDSPSEAKSSGRGCAGSGDVLNLDVPDGTSNNLCDNYFRTQAVVASVSRRAILAVDTLDGPPALLFPQTVLDSITQEFDNNTFVTDSSYFGNPTDIDGNGRVILLFTGEVNRITPAGLERRVCRRILFRGRLFPDDRAGQSVVRREQQCRDRVSAGARPDRAIRQRSARSSMSAREHAGTIPHELEHMINAGTGSSIPPLRLSRTTGWMNHSRILRRKPLVVCPGFGDLQTLTFQDMLPSGNQAARDDFNAFFFQNFARLAYWMARPDTSSGISSNSDANLSSSGADWAIGRYAADNYSNGDVRAFTRRLAAGPDNGIKNFTTVAGASLDTLMAGWLVSMYADHLGIAGLDPKYQYRSYNFRDIMPPVAQSVLGTGSVYPLLVSRSEADPTIFQRRTSPAAGIISG